MTEIETDIFLADLYALGERLLPGRRPTSTYGANPKLTSSLHWRTGPCT
ncbi:hypothetical protein OICFNHDK_3687 [Methylobacterium bullatum]|uniref:Uncharacterized protein n=1 Tax=Methylobacterium bullatum TaxID=570505 RepID=A0A679KB93_9HYPH|nr:hypothetical protein OICFNHDK_3687 [Methylobacterium bullatum]CAA2144329.1 hypothetical protein MBLL_03452 [Methylobacterium bullatum]